MSHRIVLVMLTGVSAVTGLAAAAESPDVTATLSAADLIAAVHNRTAAFEGMVKAEGEFDQAAKSGTLARDAGVVAVLAQLLVEHKGAKESKINFAGLRVAALKLQRSKTLDEAKRYLEFVGAALEGRGYKAVHEADWNKLIGLHRLMKEFEYRQSALRRVMKRADNLPDASVEATIAGALAMVLEKDTHEVDDKADIPAWVSLARDYGGTMSRLAAAMKDDDADKAREIFYTTGESCTACHKKFRK